MAIADKLTYLNATKLLLRDAIRRAGHYLPDAATFRSYPYALLPDESSLSLDFVRGEYVAHNWRDGTVSRAGLSSIMTTTRASGGGYFDHLGVYQWAANNVPRIDHDPVTISSSTTSATLAAGSVTLAVTVTYQVGSYVRATYDANNWMAGRVVASTGSSVTLWVDRVVGSGTYSAWTVIRVRGLLVEESRTNLLTHSSDFANAWIMANTSATANATIAPDGLLTANKLVENTANGTHILAISPTVTANTNYAASIFLKAGERTKVIVRYGKAGTPFTRIGVQIDLATGSFVSANVGSPTSIARQSVQYAGNGWYRISVAGVFDTTSTDGRFQIDLLNDSGVGSYTGDGTSGVYIWGAQLEIGAFPTSHIPTTTAQVTRAADQCVVSDLADWYRGDEGAVVFNGNSPNTGVRVVATLSDGSLNNRAQFAAAPGARSAAVVSGGIVQCDLFRVLDAKAALSFAENNFRFSAGGGVPSTDTSGTVPVFNQLRIGAYPTNAGYLNGHIESIQYIPRALSNTELQRITA